MEPNTVLLTYLRQCFYKNLEFHLNRITICAQLLTDLVNGMFPPVLKTDLASKSTMDEMCGVCVGGLEVYVLYGILSLIHI